MTKSILAAGFIVLASPCLAAVQLQPGEWQTTETGTEDGQPVPPQVATDCLSAEQSRDATNLIKTMRDQMQGQGAQCQTYDVKQSGESVSFTMKCGQPKQFDVDIAGVFNFVSPTRYVGTMKSAITIMGKTTTSDKKTEAVRIGDCKAGNR